jgi:Plus-3 domain
MKQPHLDETLLGAVVRVALGGHADDVGGASYSMCLVHDVTDGKQYTRVPPRCPAVSICMSMSTCSLR